LQKSLRKANVYQTRPVARKLRAALIPYANHRDRSPSSRRINVRARSARNVTFSCFADARADRLWRRLEATMLIRFLCLLTLAGAVSVVAVSPSAAVQRQRLSDDRIILGLKEALETGAGNAVAQTGRVDGYFKNLAIKILMPRQLRTVERGLRAVGYGSQVDEFVLSMNRAAEKAAPEAKSVFIGAIKEMTFDDARRILTGGDTAATQYFREKTSPKLSAAFRPIVEKSMNETGVTRQYKELIGQYQNIPFARNQSLDIDDYVVTSALNGLFYVIGEEEKKIRKNPVARVSSVLREVFGRR
jgi:hypothetical protein